MKGDKIKLNPKGKGSNLLLKKVREKNAQGQRERAGPGLQSRGAKKAGCSAEAPEWV